MQHSRLEPIRSDIEDSLLEWKTSNYLKLSDRLSYISNCSDISIKKTLFANIMSIERKKLKIISSLNGLFTHQEWELIFDQQFHLYMFSTLQKKRKHLFETILRKNPKMEKKYGIDRLKFLTNIKHLSESRINKIEWLHEYYTKNIGVAARDILIEQLMDLEVTRRNKLAKIARLDHKSNLIQNKNNSI